MNQIGLDIGSSSIKAVESKIDNKKIELVNFAKASFGSKFNLLSDSPEDFKNNVNLLSDFVVQNGFLGKYTNIAIPEHLIYTSVLTFPQLKNKELENAIKLELGQNSPIPLEESSKTFQILPKTNKFEKEITVLAVVAPNTLTSKLHKLVTESGLKVMSIEPETVCTIRSVIDEENEDTPTTLIANLGSKNSTLSIYSDFSIRFTRSLGLGFSTFIRAVADDLSLEEIQAEEYIKTYGFVADKLQGKIRDSILPVYALTLDEIKRAGTYFESRSYGNSVKRVVLTGEVSTIPGIVVHTANYLGIEVELANSFKRFNNLGKYKDRQKELDFNSPYFSTACGASLKIL